MSFLLYKYFLTSTQQKCQAGDVWQEKRLPLYWRSCRCTCCSKPNNTCTSCRHMPCSADRLHYSSRPLAPRSKTLRGWILQGHGFEGENHEVTHCKDSQLKKEHWFLPFGISGVPLSAPRALCLDACWGHVHLIEVEPPTNYYW